MLTPRFRTGDPVVLVDRNGQLLRDLRQRPQRGLVVRLTILGEYVVSLDRSGRQLTVPPSMLRRCPQLAYARREAPQQPQGGAA